MKSIEELRAFFGQDRFAAGQGIAIDYVGPEGAMCSVVLEDRHRNAAGAVQGGLIFTLADFAFAVAANSESIGTVTLNSAINYLKPPGGTRLLAEAKLVSRTRSTCVYSVTVKDDTGVHCAQAMTTGYTRTK